MAAIQQNVSLKEFNSFHIEAQARWFTEINTEDDLGEVFDDEKWHTVNTLIIGGGSNLLFTRDFDGLVIRMNIKGITHVEDGSDVYVTAGAGEVWNDFVQYCVNRGFCGAENLSLIPGSVGASPIQNIGAYGVELKDIFYTCKAYEINTGLIRNFSNEDCKFGYRDSIFKNQLKGRVVITGVTFRLSKIPHLNTRYGAIEQELASRQIQEPTIKDISEIVSEIRVSKLPDPSTIGNAGSFFKNPIVEVDKFRHLKSIFPDIVHFPTGSGTEKIAAGWLIEKCGWKGRKLGEAGTWKNQALVLVNFGSATGSEIYELSEQIIADVEGRFGIRLDREVNII